eukprot:SAG22_NODE_8363_length_661_cov_1.371886_1_plen_92_part_00
MPKCPGLQALYADKTGWTTKHKVFNAMVSTVDETAGNVSTALKDAGMWADTLLVWSTDNGSPVAVAGTNAPLRGGKGAQNNCLSRSCRCKC